MNGWIDGWICKNISDEVPLLFTRQIHHGRGPRSDRCFNGAPCFFQLALLESIHVLLQKVHGLETVCGKLKKKHYQLFVFFCQREIRCLFLGWKESRRYHPKKSSRSVNEHLVFYQRYHVCLCFNEDCENFLPLTVSMIWVNHILVKGKVQFQKM